MIKLSLLVYSQPTVSLLDLIDLISNVSRILRVCFVVVLCTGNLTLSESAPPTCVCVCVLGV